MWRGFTTLQVGRERETAKERGGRETEKRWKWKRGAGRAKTISQAL